MFLLLHLQKDGTYKKYTIHTLPAILGRSKKASIQIQDKSVSREHARVFEREGSFYLADLNSSNGTFVNGEKTSLDALKPGDEIRLGAAVLKIALPEASDEAQSRKGSASEHSPIKREPITVKDPFLGAQRDHPVRIDPGQDFTGIGVKDKILQFHRIDSKKGQSFLKTDFNQYGGLWRLLILLFFLFLATGIFFLFHWLGSEVTPLNLEGAGKSFSEDKSLQDF